MSAILANVLNACDNRVRLHVRILRGILWALVLYVVLSSAVGLCEFVTVDEETFWHGGRTLGFWRALLEGNFEDNRDALEVSDKPGLTSVWLAGGAYLAFQQVTGLEGPSEAVAKHGRWATAFGSRTNEANRMRLVVRRVQRFACYCVCMLACWAVALALRATFMPDAADIGPFRPLVLPFLFLLLAATPVVRMHARLVLPDAMMACFGSLAVSCAFLAATRGSRNAQTWALLASGALIGLAVLSKYSGFFALASVLVAVYCWSFSPLLAAGSVPLKQQFGSLLGRFLLRTLTVLAGLSLVAYALQPVAWRDPLAAFAVAAPLETFLRPDRLASLLAVGVPLAVGAVAALIFLRPWVGPRWRGLLFAGSMTVAVALMVGIFVALVWQRDGLCKYTDGNWPGGIPGPDAYTWRCWKDSTMTYHRGWLVSHLLHFKRILTFLATTTPLYLLVPIGAAPAILASAWRRRHSGSIWSVFCGVAALQGFLVMLLLMHGLPLFPVQTRYLLLTYFAWTLYGGLLVLLLALRRPRTLPLVLGAFAVCSAVVHGMAFPYNMSFVNTLRSRALANDFRENAYGAFDGDPVYQERGANLVHVARFMNEKYRSATPEARATMAVLAGYPGFAEFYEGPTVFNIHLREPWFHRFPYIVVSGSNAGYSPTARALLRERDPIFTVRHQGIDFAWLFHFPEHHPLDPGLLPSQNVVANHGFETDVPDPNWRFPPTVTDVEAHQGSRCARVVETWPNVEGLLEYHCPSDWAYGVDIALFVKPVRSDGMAIGVVQTRGLEQHGSWFQQFHLEQGVWQEVRYTQPVLWGPYDLRIVIHALDVKSTAANEGEILVDDMDIRLLTLPAEQ